MMARRIIYPILDIKIEMIFAENAGFSIINGKKMNEFNLTL